MHGESHGQLCGFWDSRCMAMVNYSSIWHHSHFFSKFLPSFVVCLWSLNFFRLSYWVWLWGEGNLCVFLFSQTFELLHKVICIWSSLHLTRITQSHLLLRYHWEKPVISIVIHIGVSCVYYNIFDICWRNESIRFPPKYLLKTF